MSDELQKALLIRRAYSAVDAAVTYYLSGVVQTNPEFRRYWRASSAGSSLHRLSVAENKDIVAVEIRSAGLEKTIVTVFTGSALKDYAERESFLIYVAMKIEEEIERLDTWVKQLESAHTSPKTSGELDQMALSLFQRLTPPSKPRGAPTDEDNDWARAQIAANADRAAVYNEWARRRNLNPDDPKNRDAFRKALKRSKPDGNK